MLAMFNPRTQAGISLRTRPARYTQGISDQLGLCSETLEVKVGKMVPGGAGLSSLVPERLRQEHTALDILG